MLDARFAASERGLLRRLSIGLSSEGVEVTFLCPPSVAGAISEGMLSSVIAANVEAGQLERWSAKRVIRESLTAAGLDECDVVHAFGGKSIAMAAEIARGMDALLAVEVWRARMAPRLRATLDAHGFKHGAAVRPLVLCVPSSLIAKRLEEAGINAGIRVTPWGVHAPAPPETPAGAARRNQAIVFAGRGLDGKRYLAAFDAVCSLARERPNVLLFVDAVASHRLQLWKRVVASGLQSRVTLVGDLEATRDAALAADLFVHPEARGECRSILLDAMATGACVIAAKDPDVSWIIGDETAKVVRSDYSDGWRSAVTDVLDHTAVREDLRQRAFAHIRQHHTVSGYVTTTLDAYESTLAAHAQRS